MIPEYLKQNRKEQPGKQSHWLGCILRKLGANQSLVGALLATSIDFSNQYHDRVICQEKTRFCADISYLFNDKPKSKLGNLC